MGTFTKPLDVRYLPHEDLWEILESFEFHSVEKDAGLFIRVKKGDKTDFFSIPWLFRRVLPKSGPGNQAAVIHDKGYKTGVMTMRIGSETKDVKVYKSNIDSMFLDALKSIADSMPTKKKRFWMLVKSHVVYNAVKYGGFAVWNEYERTLHKIGR